jgi:hypothetical protein
MIRSSVRNANIDNGLAWAWKQEKQERIKKKGEKMN